MIRSAVVIVAVAGVAVAAAFQVSVSPADRAKVVERTFAPFSPSVKTRHDDTNFYVESDGLPDHELMVGITAWQQQVPLPQSYRGANAWQFPLYPREAESPRSAKEGFFRGAIAIAANGVPIFNPIKNDGRTDTALAGELDKFGGHGGRADDYHYHLAPLHLVTKLGENTPIAYALDGYPIYGLKCTDGKVPTDLDRLNGHTRTSLGYHYHATGTYPYLNGGFHGVVTEREGQVDPQPQARPVRPSLPPLRGAKVTEFERLGDNRYRLAYVRNGQTYTIRYAIQKNGDTTFEFIDPDGSTRTETYRGQGPRGSEDPSKPRRPWLVEHSKELDTDGDGKVTLVEIDKLVRAAWSEVAGTTSSITIEALKAARPARNVIGGYLKGHAAEFDANGDKSLTLDEILGEFSRLLHKADGGHDHVLSGAELLP